MENQKSKLQPYHLLLCWLFTVTVGSAIGCLVAGEIQMSILLMPLSAISSLPFILLFLLVFRWFLKTTEDTMNLQLKVLGIHVLGSFLTFVGFVIFFNRDLGSSAFEFILLMSGYFLLDTILFHTVIYKLHKKTASKPRQTDLIDDF